MNETPKLIKRRSGGWLAVSGRIKIGIDASTQEEAISIFNERRARWAEILSPIVTAPTPEKVREGGTE